MTNGKIHPWGKCLLIALTFGVIAWCGIALTRGDGRVAAVWLPNAFLLAVLLRSRGDRDGSYLAAGFLGNLVANLVAGDALAHGVFLAGANALEIALACVGVRKTCGPRPDLADPRQLGWFVAIAGLVAPAVSASLAAFVLSSSDLGNLASLWTTWLVTDGLGLLIGTPFLLIMADALRDRRPMPPAKLAEWAALTVAGLLVLLLIFSQSRFPLLFVAAPVALVFAFRLGAAGTAVAMIMIAVIASAMTSMGRGPIHLVRGDLTLKLLILQAFLVTSFFMGLPIAAALRAQKRDRVSLQRHREMSRSMLEKMREVVFRTDAQGRWIFLNPAWEALTGYGVKTALGWPTTKLLHPEDLAQAAATYRRIVSGEIDEIVLRQRFFRADGACRHIEVSVRALRSAKGRFRGTIGNIRDVTEQVEAAAALAEREAQLALLANNATDAIFRLGLDGACLYASPSVRDLLGISPENLVGRDMLTGFHAEDAPAVLAAHRELAGGEVERMVITYRSRPLDGRAEWIWLEANCGLVRDRKTGAPSEIIASIRDISDRKALQMELEAARRVAIAAAEAKSTFLANMSHEIRTPMNGVIGFTDLLLQSPLAPEQHRHAQLIADSGRTMMQLLNDVLDISKIEAGQMRVVEETVDLRHLLRGSLKLVAPAAEAKGLRLGLEIDACLPFWIEADGLRLRQVALNLLSNAVKFTEQGSVTVRASAAFEHGAQRLRVQVVDTGIGIPADRHAAVLAPFQQADDHTARRFGGTGLGLAISDQLARLMGGHISLESEVGRGTTFTLTLPLKHIRGQAPKPKRAPSPERDEAVARAPIRILVAEDMEVNRILMRDMLRSLGQEIEVAEDGAETVAMVAAAADEGRPYRLIFMDVQMPNLDGLAATRLIRAHGHAPEALPIVALTANAYAEDVAACLEAGMQAHLSKPVRLDALRGALERFGGGAPVAAPEAAGAPALPPGLRAQFQARLDALVSELERGIEAGRIEDAQAVGNALHQIAGTAALFDLPDVGEAANALQNVAELPPAEQISRSRLFLERTRKAA